MPNPSFEDTVACPTYYSYFPVYNAVINAPPWFIPTWGTSDYFNQCNDSIVSVPLNFKGYQPAKTGFAYMGMWTAGPNYREYISAPLLNSLQAGTVYYCSMFINLACTSGSTCYSGADRIGMYFSIGSPDTTGVSSAEIPVVPQIENASGNILNDTLNWVKIYSSFIATGGENYITIGNFRDMTNTIGIGYYYIDDVVVSTDSLFTIGIDENIQHQDLLLFPNPFSDQINITAKTNEPLEITLFDITSRKLLQQQFTNTLTLNTSHLSKGIYIYELRPVPFSSGNKNGVIKKGKIVKD